MSARVDWATGSARAHLDREFGPHRLPFAVEIRLPGAIEKTLALLDTGAQWLVVGGELAERFLRGNPDVLDSMSIQTRLGRILGNLARLEITLLAEPGHGQDLAVEGTVLLAPPWSGPVVVGTRGMLEKVRFEVDPDPGGVDSWWSFAVSSR